MTAADKREELEAAVWRRMPKAMPRGAVLGRVNAILAIADEYAAAVADERIAGRVHDRTVGRERLAELNAAVRGGS